jgi:O-antigen ligase
LDDLSKNSFSAQSLFAFAAYLLAFSLPVSIVSAQVAAGLVLLFGAWLLLGGAARNRIRPLPAAFLTSFLLLLVLSAILSPSFALSVPQLKKSWVLLCFFPLAAFMPHYSLRRALQFLVFGAGLASLIGVYRFSVEGLERAAPYSGGYTTMALIEAAAIPCAIVFAVKEKRHLRLTNVVSLIAMTAGLIASQTRAGWFAAIVAALIVGFSASKKATSIALLIVLIVVFSIPQTRNLVLNRFETEKKGGITSGRTILWNDAAGRLANLPFFGYGPGCFKRLVSPQLLDEIGDKGVASWHSTLLDILIESGPLAALALAALMVVSLIGSIRNYLKSGRRLQSLAVISSLLSIYLCALATNLFRDFMLMGLLTLLWISAFDLEQLVSSDDS